MTDRIKAIRAVIWKLAAMRNEAGRIGHWSRIIYGLRAWVRREERREKEKR